MESLYQTALKIDPDDAYVNHFYGLWLLKNGNLKEGWKHSAFRTQRIASHIPFMFGKIDVPYWKGEDLKDKGLIVWTEQGVGDEVLLCSMLPDILKQTKRVLLVCSKDMVELFARSFPGIVVVRRESLFNFGLNIRSYEYQASLSELGAVLRPDKLSFGTGEAFLKVDPAKVWTPNANGNLKVGISWRSTNKAITADKSIALSHWERILKSPNIDFVSLQHGGFNEELERVANAYGTTVYEPQATGNIDTLAHVIAGLDLVISVSNTNVHLAGGLGVPCWTMVQRGRGGVWYWFRENDDSPWYKSLTLHRYAAGEARATMDKVGYQLNDFHYLKKGQY